jgi:DNA (cytosine-5)-methyltransferase 1
METQTMNTFYEFFAGGGMARAGLGRHWQCLLANDICAAKGRSYAANWGDDHLIVRDIYDINASELPAYGDLAWGSFPCQDLSLAGAGLGLQGERSGAFWGFWKIIQGLNKDGRKPKMAVIENVFGALTSHQGQDFELIANAVAKEGYTVGAMVIDAVYFVPQSRPRLHHRRGFVAGHPQGNTRCDASSSMASRCPYSRPQSFIAAGEGQLALVVHARSDGPCSGAG